MRITSAGKTPLKPGQAAGIGHPNLIFQRDYRDIKGWCVVVDTIVPVKNENEIKDWLDSGRDIRLLTNSLIEQTPDGGDQTGARHMLAAALGFELGADGKSLEPRAFTKTKPVEKEVRPGR